MSDQKLLPGIHEPADLRALPREQLGQVTQELRYEIVHRVSQTGGHLASSLGAVELITAIHYVFETPRDRLVLDVGHQGYPHKMLTGRRERFDSLGKEGGIAKFLRRSESPFDHFGAGHAGPHPEVIVGGIDDGVHLAACDIAFDQFNPHRWIAPGPVVSSPQWSPRQRSDR